MGCYLYVIYFVIRGHYTLKFNVTLKNKITTLYFEHIRTVNRFLERMPLNKILINTKLKKTQNFEYDISKNIP